MSSCYSQKLIPFLKGDKYGYSDLDRKIIIDAVYDDAKSMEEGIGIVTIDGNIGAVNLAGEIIAEIKYQDVEIKKANNKNYLVVRLNRLYGLIDENGIEIIPCEFENVSF